MLLFCCWAFRGQTPALAAQGGWLRLPAGTVCLEDAETHPAARGRGISPAALSAMADALAAEGKQQMVAKIADDNRSSRRAIQKAGFGEFAVMHFRRSGPLRRASVEVLDPARAALANELLDGVSGNQRTRG